MNEYVPEYPPFKFSDQHITRQED